MLKFKDPATQAAWEGLREAAIHRYPHPSDFEADVSRVEAAFAALEAHVEAGKELLKLRNPDMALAEWAGTAPITSLARLKAEVVQGCADRMRMRGGTGDQWDKGWQDAVDSLDGQAEQLRRQAEGGE